MMKTTPHGPDLSVPPGVRVVPDLLVIPLRASVRGESPSAALARLEQLEEALGTATPSAELQVVGYRSWTEKLVGKGLRGRGVRHHATATLRLQVKLDADASVVSRRRTLETLRAALAPFDDGDRVQVGAATWTLAHPDTRLDACLQQLRARADAVRKTLEVDVKVAGAIDAVQVACVGPRDAYLTLAAQLQLA